MVLVSGFRSHTARTLSPRLSARSTITSRMPSSGRTVLRNFTSGGITSAQFATSTSEAFASYSRPSTVMCQGPLRSSCSNLNVVAT